VEAALMPTYRVRMIVYNRQGWSACHGGGATREVTTRFVGCADAEDARRKARAIYPVAEFKSVQPEEGEEV
jgi:hypothetical protein